MSQTNPFIKDDSDLRTILNEFKYHFRLFENDEMLIRLSILEKCIKTAIIDVKIESLADLRKRLTKIQKNDE
jgi:hypothetical protein